VLPDIDQTFKIDPRKETEFLKNRVKKKNVLWVRSIDLWIKIMTDPTD
jgi:hypothetical protein